MTAGALAENLTLAGIDETGVCIGDRFRVGDCEIEVSQPRQPCWKIARRWGVKSLTKEVTQTGRTGWYIRVITEGTLEVGQQLERLDRPNPDWSVARANDVLFGREADRMAVFELMNLKELAEAWRKDIG
jgi:MOSC domain-containing protein YiiM